MRVLSAVVPMNILQNARTAIGATPDFTVPGMLNFGWSATGSGHAVTIGNLMIFSRQLSADNLNDWRWLLHELHHTEQYQSYSNDILESIDGFAVAYLSNYNALESDAENTAVQRLNTLCSIYVC